MTAPITATLVAVQAATTAQQATAASARLGSYPLSRYAADAAHERAAAATAQATADALHWVAVFALLAAVGGLGIVLVTASLVPLVLVVPMLVMAVFAHVVPTRR